ncbi:endospore germination permease [Paenibacillus doosanensis]|uniref:Spore germination protein n=1 Tax=Paenibacillus konkukensis TaxID=2020716 RepID=A0ABY4RM60_9BACL|nr:MULTISPECIES: endospore germination permease [Paenibacillus]MCS7460682.1 endospore germination permease [Paenibacillus doosanensis]UQZ82663.1 Spore germination protein [Paenibacillus konkukensis]
MDNKFRKIGIFPFFSVIILAVGLMNHVMVMPPLLQDAKRDAWISVLVTIVPYLLWAAMLYYIIRKTNQQPLLPWLQLHCGKLVSGLLRLIFVVYFFLISLLTMKETVMWTHSSYLTRTPIFALSIVLVLLCALAVHLGIKAIAIASGILLPFVVIFGDFVMSTNLPAKNYSLLTPIMEYGPQPALKGAIYVGGGLVELIMILFVQQEMKTKLKLWHLWSLALFLVLLVMGPVTGAIAEFGPHEAALLRFPSFEEWRIVQIGKYIRHVDFLSIYQWISGAFARISFSLYLQVELLSMDSGKRIRYMWLLIISLMTVAIMEVPISDMQYLSFLKDIYLPFALWTMTGLLTVIFLIVLFVNLRKEVK